MITKTTTTDVEAKACFGVGHTTFFSSTFTSFKNCFIFCILFINVYAELISITMKMAGQEGLEPPASGFGVRRSIQLELLARIPHMGLILKQDVAHVNYFVSL